jgi:effector-binding domain-containing protein
MGSHLTRWHQAAEVLVEEVAEAMVPVDRPVTNQGQVRVYELPAVEVASYVHEGNFEDFGQGHTILLKWIEDHGYRIAGDYRELYIKHDLTDLSNSITEIQYPIEK